MKQFITVAQLKELSFEDISKVMGLITGYGEEIYMIQLENGDSELINFLLEEWSWKINIGKMIEIINSVEKNEFYLSNNKLGWSLEFDYIYGQSEYLSQGSNFHFEDRLHNKELCDKLWDGLKYRLGICLTGKAV